MISAKKLIIMARKWQKISVMGRKRITFPRTKQEEEVTTATSSSSSSTTTIVEKGHFVVYTSDQKRFVVPIAYLNNTIFQQLLKMSEEEFGLSSEGPIGLPCDSVFFEYVRSLLQRGLGRDLENALLNSIASCYQSAASLTQEHTAQQLLVYGY